MIFLLDKENDTVGYLDGDDCKDLDNNILGHIKRDDNDPQLNYILGKNLNIRGKLYGNEFKYINEYEEKTCGHVSGNDLIDETNEIIGHIKIEDTNDAKNISRAGAVLFFFFDLTTAHYIKKYTKKAEKGNIISQYNLAIEYLTDPVYKNHKKAFYWFEKAAEQGDAQAQFNLGIMFFNGESVQKNIDKAIEWCEKAAKGGEEKAKEFLVEAKAMKTRAEQEERERKEREEHERKQREEREERERKEREELEERERKEREERERKERERQEWLASDEGQKWQKKESRKREKERKKREMKEWFWKIGRIAALVFVIFSITMLFVSLGVSGDSDTNIAIILSILFIIPFAVIYFCEGIVKRIISLIAGIGIAIWLLSLAINNPGDAESPFFIILSISYIISCVLAMINEKDKY